MRFSQKGDVPRHERTHTGEKSYACSICSMRFAQKSSAAPHEQTHTAEKPIEGALDLPNASAAPERGWST